MRYCTHCGQALGTGAFCTSCGRPAAPSEGAAVRVRDLGTDTAERPAVALPPAQPEVPSNARFPLFADEAGPVVVPAPAPSYDSLSLLLSPEPLPTRVSGPLFAPDAAPEQRRGRPWAWLILGAVAVGLVLAGVLWWALAGAGGDDVGSSRTGSPSTATDDRTTSPGRGNDQGPADGAPDRAREVAASASAVVPDVAPPNADIGGRPVSYGADHLFDGDPTTTWRMPGDGTGSLIVIRLGEPTDVRRVGLVNGYAKTAVDSAGRTVDWYLRNRRVLAVRWSFDDGSVVDQRLSLRPTMQVVDVGHEVTGTIRLRLVDVSPPKPGPLGRDYTAISEISVLGSPS